MPPRPAPDLAERRDQVVLAARTVAEAEGWGAVTMRRLASGLGVTQPVLYSVFDGRQALVDAVALEGFDALASALEAVEASPLERMRAYLDFAAANPAVYEAMFTLPSGLPFDAADTPAPLVRAFTGVRDAFPDGDDVRAEVAWATLHGLAVLQASGRLPLERAQQRLELAHRAVTA